MTHAHSERDLAWFEEVAEALQRGCAALREAHEHPAPKLLATADSGAPDEATLRLLLETDTRPNVGATALALTALARSGFAVRQKCYATVHSALQFLLAAQARDGGWPVNASAPASSCAATTAQVLEALGHFGFRVGQVGAAVTFVLAHQEANGSWVNCPRATWQVIAGLGEVGFDRFALPVRRAVRWLKESQSEDGSWGAETAGAVLALVAAGDADSPEARAGAEFLVGTQRAAGTWSDAEASCLALMALGRYLRECNKPQEQPKVFVRADAGHRVSGPRSARHTLAEL